MHRTATSFFWGGDICGWILEYIVAQPWAAHGGILKKGSAFCVGGERNVAL